MRKRKPYIFSHVFVLCTILLLSCVFGILCTKANVSAATKTTLKTKSKSLYINGTYTIPLNNKKKKATYFYTSNKTRIAKVNSKGKITARGKGSAKIKVRYKYKKKTYSAGTFKVTVQKATLRSNIRTMVTTVGSQIPVSSYLNDQNPSATYEITGTNPAVASGSSNGTITVNKAGSTTLTIVEKFNGKKRTLGKFSISASGASLGTTAIKMAYGTSYNASSIIVDKLPEATYSLASTDNNMLAVSGMNLTAGADPGYNSVQQIYVYENNAGQTRLMGYFSVSLIQTVYIAQQDRNISVGLGAKLSVSNEYIRLTNPDPTASYSLISKNTAVIDDELTAVNYGTAEIAVQEQKAGSSTATLLDETVTVTVTSATIKTELITNGLDLIVDDVAYNDYPVINRNHMVKYFYKSSSDSICQVGTGGDGENQDYLVLYPKNAGTVTITVSEIALGGASQRTIGSFEVRIAKDTAEIENVDDLMAADLLSLCSLYYKGKTFRAKLEEGTRNCRFVDDNGVGILDYGLDFERITQGNFMITPRRNRFLIDHMEQNEDNPSEWTVYLDIQNATGDHGTDIIPLHIYLQEAPLDAAALFQGIQLNVGNSRATINQWSTMPNDDQTLQFANSNTDFVAQFTKKQFLAAGATQFDPNELNPVRIADLTNVFCTPIGSTWSSTNPNASVAVTAISGATSEDNLHWNYTVTFENGVKKNFTVTINVTE